LIEMASKLRTPLCDVLGMEYPVFLAGMAVGGIQETAPTPIKLVAAVSNAGGLGVLGDSFRTLDEMDAGIKELKKLTNGRPYGVDFLLPATRADVTATSNKEVFEQIVQEYPAHIAVMKEIVKQEGLEEAEVSEGEPMSTDLLKRKIEVVLDNKVPVFAAATGVPPEWFTERGHQMGMQFIGMCGAVRHAERQVAANVDIITAQGTEAGGHTGNISTFVLVPQIVKAISPRPVLAAGGIGSGRHVAASLALGAQGVWVGTAFLASEETNIPEDHQNQILSGRSEQFTTSKFSSGKQQRSFHNLVKDAWVESGLQALPMPLQGILMEPMTQAAKAIGRWDLVGNPSGQVSGMLTERRPAKDILMDMVEEAEDTIESMQQNLK
jgi:NAD(P)H-dependent flavin oxidoreductase YrpB (nitropropane dioxygenase family)